MASWKEERDRLVAQTLAFVQQVATTHPAIGHRLGSPAVASTIDTPATDLAYEAATGTFPPAAVPPTEAPSDDVLIVPGTIVADLPPRPSRYAAVSERADISRRVAAFKARQMRLDRERADFYDVIQAQIRATLEKKDGAERP